MVHRLSGFLGFLLVPGVIFPISACSLGGETQVINQGSSRAGEADTEIELRRLRQRHPGDDGGGGNGGGGAPPAPAKPDLRETELAQRNSMIQQIRASGAGNASDAQIAQILDFLIQDVCMDSQGRATAEDPANCGYRRNLAAGETLPYIKVDVGPDFPNAVGPGWQRSDSVPFQDRRGYWHNLKTFDFGGPYMPGKYWGVFEDGQDGFDVTELVGTHVSYSVTKDGINDNYWAGSGCRLSDGWVLFPWTISRGVPANIAHDIYLVGVRQVCAEQMRNTSAGAWNWLGERVGYTGGKSLETITTHHWSHPNANDATSFELNYYTREYGATRWEAWVKCSASEACVAPNAANECNGAQVQNINGQPWKRTGCRDWTVLVPGDAGFPSAWVDLSNYRLCLYGTGKFGDGSTCQ